MVKIGGGGILAKQERLAINLGQWKPLVPAVKTQENLVCSRVAIARRLSAAAFTARSVGFCDGHVWWWLRGEREGDRNLPPCSILNCQADISLAVVLLDDLREWFGGHAFPVPPIALESLNPSSCWGGVVILRYAVYGSCGLVCDDSSHGSVIG